MTQRELSISSRRYIAGIYVTLRALIFALRVGKLGDAGAKYDVTAAAAAILAAAIDDDDVFRSILLSSIEGSAKTAYFADRLLRPHVTMPYMGRHGDAVRFAGCDGRWTVDVTGPVHRLQAADEWTSLDDTIIEAAIGMRGHAVIPADVYQPSGWLQVFRRDAAEYLAAAAADVA